MMYGPCIPSGYEVITIIVGATTNLIKDLTGLKNYSRSTITNKLRLRKKLIRKIALKLTMIE